MLAEAGIALEDPADFHVTLAFYGDKDALEGVVDFERARHGLAELAMQSVPLQARVSGLGRFTSVPAGQPHVLYASVDVPGLGALRDWIVQTLALYGLRADTTHGFTPHCTLAYLDPACVTPPLTLPPLEWTLDHITLAIGDERQDFPLGTPPVAPLYPYGLPAEARNPLAAGVSWGATVAARAATQQDDSGDDQAILDALVAAFAMTAQAIQDLARQIYLARVQAFSELYRAQAQSLGITLAPDWQPPDDVLAQEAEEAQAAAAGIAQTYNDDLRSAAAAALAAWHDQHGAFTTESSRTQAKHDCAALLVGWASSRASWKARQIAAVETGTAAHRAIGLLVADILATLGGDDTTGLDLGGDMSEDSYVVAVLPEYSSPDDCADYAGEVYPLSAYSDLPTFPAHPFCIHYTVVLAVGAAADLNDAEEA